MMSNSSGSTCSRGAFSTLGHCKDIQQRLVSCLLRVWVVRTRRG
jgi:hypothetical protein